MIFFHPSTNSFQLFGVSLRIRLPHIAAHELQSGVIISFHFLYTMPIFAFTHSMLNALSTLSNETALDQIQISVSIALCVVAGVSTYLIFRNYKRKKLGGVG